MSEPEDKKVKELLDAATRAELEKWFGLPSYEQLAERRVEPPPPDEDPEFAVIRKRRDDAIAAVDPAMVEAHRRRVEPPRPVVKPLPPVELHVDPDIALFDMAMLDRQVSVAEPREMERPRDLEDVLAERTPQALLRDLHRPEFDFEKVFERVDMLAEERRDAHTAVAAAMASSLKLPPLEAPAFAQSYALLRELRAERQQPWINIEMPLRQVKE
ncbi:MAG: hypothetical protein E6J90_24930 [Deltaproteobacteria bacterium]|nr:MAG: hypothetical protein E6J91_25480 [Deltaproteobacteria bacterium]TMQ15789.1 MAG: hypothetical protein E6J90_24930 [Deltaproteobacteria bacterium]